MAFLSVRGRVAVVTGAVLTVTGLVFGGVELAQAGLAVVGLVTCCLLSGWFRGRSTVALLSVHPAAVAVGDPVSVTGLVRRKRSNVASATTSPSPDPLCRSSPFSLAVNTAQRGAFDLGGSMEWRADPLGLVVVRQKALSDHRRLLIHPRPLVPAGGRPAPRLEDDSGAFLKPFVAGDELRRVHWPTSRRLGQWMIQVPAVPLRGTIAVLVDLRPEVHTPDSFEQALGLAAGLVSPRGGGPARLVTTSGLDSGPLATPARFAEVLAALATARPRTGPAPEALLQRLPALRRSEKVIVVTTPAGSPLRARRHRRVDYVVTAGPTQIRQTPARVSAGSERVGTSPPVERVPLQAQAPSREGRMVAFAGRLGSTGVAVGALGALFTGNHWIVPLVVAALAGHGIPLLARAGSRRRPMPSWVPSWVTGAIGAFGGLVGTAAVAGVVAARGNLGHLTVTSAWAALGEALGSLPLALESVGVPAPELPSLVVAATVAVGVAAVASEALSRLRQPWWPGLPAVVLVGFGGLEGSGHIPAVTTAALAGAMVLAIGLLVGGGSTVVRAQIDRRPHRGPGARNRPVLPGYPRPPSRGRRVFQLAGATVAAGTCLVLGGWLGPKVISAGGGGYVSLRSTSPAALVGVNPTVSFAPDLSETNGPVLFEVSSPVPDYWRLTTLERLGPAGFVANTPSFVPTVTRGQPLPPGRRVVEVFHLVDLATPWLPVGGIPLSTTGLPSTDWAPKIATLFDPGGAPADPGRTYRVDAFQPAPTLGDLLGASLVAHPPSIDVAAPSEPARVVALAHQVVAGMTTPFGKASAIQDYLRTHETYNLHPPAGPGNPLVRFLFVTHQGYCQQFAATFALLARIDGLPTRLAVGSTPGRLVHGDTYQVTTADIHTWPEVLFARLGWVRFEPTPGRGAPGNTGYTGVAPTQVGNHGATSIAPVRYPRTSADPSLSLTVPQRPTQRARRSTGGALLSPASRSTAVPGLGSGALAALATGSGAVALVLVGLFLWVIRSRRRSGARRAEPRPPATPRTPATTARGPRGSPAVPGELADAWARACARVGPIIGERHETETLSSFARRAEGQVAADAAADLRGLADTLDRALFGPGPVSP